MTARQSHSQMGDKRAHVSIRFANGATLSRAASGRCAGSDSRSQTPSYLTDREKRGHFAAVHDSSFGLDRRFGPSILTAIGGANRKPYALSELYLL
jgi:hypothetical protein